MKLILILATALALSGCASLTKVSKQPEALNNVKKVGIVGYSIQHQEPDTVMQRIGSSKLGIGGGGGDITPTESGDVDAVYETLSARLKSEMKWNVMTPGQLDSNPKYRKLVNDYTTGVIVRNPLPPNFITLRPHQVLDAGAFDRMKAEQKNQLIKDLGLDAIVIVTIISSLEEEGGMKKYIGMSEFRPKSQVKIEVLDGKSENAIWFDSWAWGKGDKAVPSKLRAVDNRELMEQVKIAVNHGYEDLFGRFKNQ